MFCGFWVDTFLFTSKRQIRILLKREKQKKQKVVGLGFYNLVGVLQNNYFLYEERVV